MFLFSYFDVYHYSNVYEVTKFNEKKNINESNERFTSMWSHKLHILIINKNKKY